MSWRSWLKEQASVVADGISEFKDQLNDESSDLGQLNAGSRQTASRFKQVANEKLSELVDADTVAQDAEVAQAALAAGRERAAELGEKVNVRAAELGSQVKSSGVMKGVEGAPLSDPVS